MYVIRILAVLLLIALGVLLFAYVVSGKQDYLTLAWRLFRYILFLALGIFALMALERVAVMAV